MSAIAVNVKCGISRALSANRRPLVRRNNPNGW